MSSIDFATLSLNETSYTQQHGMFRGWGSEETRKAYSSLHQLGNSTNATNLANSQALNGNGIPTDEKSNMDDGGEDFFISEDDMDCDVNFW